MKEIITPKMIREADRHAYQGAGIVKRKRKRRIGVKYCDDCDGCGWTEGGKYLKTLCKTCNGNGVVPIERVIGTPTTPKETK